MLPGLWDTEPNFINENQWKTQKAWKMFKKEVFLKNKDANFSRNFRYVIIYIRR
jgi:hypothetical protein